MSIQQELATILDYLRWVLARNDALSPEEMEEVRLGTEEIRRGESISLEDYLHQRQTSQRD